jgi:dihydropteroate synthase
VVRVHEVGLAVAAVKMAAAIKSSNGGG